MSVQPNNIYGLLNIDKPKGITSHDVIARVRKLSNQRKVGHTGTLDPMATGVLLVCLGQATRLIEYIVPGQKQYRAVVRFGTSTDTLDTEGRVTATSDPSGLTETSLRQILPSFTGQINQIPPLFSALKRGGQPLYKLARAGRKVELSPRPVTIHSLNWVSWTPPDLTLDIVCSSGTYIRSLARDIGQAAGSEAHLFALVRTANGSWLLADATPLAEIEQEAKDDNWQKYLHSPDRAINHLPCVTLSEENLNHIQHGRQIQIEFAPTPNMGLLRAYTPNNEFIAILTPVQSSDKLWKPKKLFKIYQHK